MAAGKSPIAGSADPTRRNAVIAALEVNAIFSFNLLLRIHRHIGSGRGTTNAPDPQTGELGDVDHLTKKLQGAPPREGKPADSKTRTDATSTSMAPPAGNLPDPTLCTGRDLRFPQPPAAEAAAGGRGNRRSPASEVG